MGSIIIVMCKLAQLAIIMLDETVILIRRQADPVSVEFRLSFLRHLNILGRLEKSFQ